MQVMTRFDIKNHVTYMSEPVTFIQMLRVRNAMLLHVCFLTHKTHSLLHVNILHVKILHVKVLHVKVIPIPGGSCQEDSIFVHPESLVPVP